MPCIARRVEEGGIGFDYRLHMAIPDKWIELLKGVKDEQWNMGNITFTLLNRRFGEKAIAYAESHDQALVGDKTIAFWLMDKEMYTHMSILQPISLIIDRGISLHKLLRLLTYCLGGEGYLNFMGNEFGHPEWIDFPREGNGWSFHCARRRWDLPKDSLLRYQHLYNFDKAMHSIEAKSKFLTKPTDYVWTHEEDKMIVVEKAKLVFIFNFHPVNSVENYTLGVNFPGKYIRILESDAPTFGGHERLAGNAEYFTQPNPAHQRPQSIQVYVPSRVCLVLALETEFNKFAPK